MNLRTSLSVFLLIVVLLTIFLSRDSTRQKEAEPFESAGISPLNVEESSKSSVDVQIDQDPSGATIQGRVVTPEGNAASRAEVRLLAVNWPDRLPSTGRILSGNVLRNEVTTGDVALKADLTDCWNPVFEVLADDDGRFRFGGVPEGIYLVCAASPDSTWSTDGNLIACDGGDDFSLTTTIPLRPALDIQLRVTNDDLPAEGVRVCLTSRLGGRSFSIPALWELILSPINARLLTDTDGFAQGFRMPQYDFQVRAYSPELGTAETTYSVWEPGVNCQLSESGEFIRTATRPKTLRLISGVLVEGVVRDSEGSPIEGAGIELQREPGLYGKIGLKNTRVDLVSTDAEGRYRFDQVSQGIYTIRVEKERFAQQSRNRLYSGTITGTSVDFVLTPAIILKGVVRDDSGEPLAGVRIQSVIDSGDSVLSDEEGLFELVAKEQGAVVNAFKPCYSAPGWKVITGDRLNEITLQKIDALRGRVLNSAGQPIKDAVLGVSGDGVKSGYMDSVNSTIQDVGLLDGNIPKPLVTDGAGAFAGCPTGKGPSLGVLQIHAAGYEPLLVPLGESRQGDFGDLVLRPLSYLEGTVFDPYGAPLPAAKVRIISAEEGGGWDVYALSGEDGSYRLPVPRAGDLFHAQANHPRYLPNEKVLLPVIGSGKSLNLDLSLNPGAGVEFRILLDGEPAPSTYIELKLKSEATLSAINPSGITDSDGVHLFEGLLPGPFRYTIECPGAGIRNGEVVLEEGVIAVVTENLTRAEKLKIIVSDTTGRAPVGASVLVYDRFGVKHNGKRERDDSFLVVGHSPGNVKVKATAPGFSRVETDWIDPEGEPVNIVLREATEVRFQLVDALDNRPLSEATLFDFNTEEYQGINSEGVAVVSHLPSGKHRFAAEMRNYRIQFPVITLGTRPQEYTVYLDRGREIDVEIVDTSGSPASGAKLQLNPGKYKGEYPWSPIYDTWTSDSNGRVRIGGLESGSNVLVATRENYRSRRVEFRTGNTGEITTVPIVLERVATVSGRILDRNGKPVRDAKVSLQQLESRWKEIGRKKSSYSSGSFLFPEVNPGPYRIVAESDGREASIEFEVTGTEPVVIDLQF